MFRPTDTKIDRAVWSESENDKALLFYQGAFDLSEEIARKAQTELEQKLFRKTFLVEAEENLKEGSLLKITLKKK
ncbi:hypothetical protein [Nitrosopumilus sp.]|uniref:hypothetical protein n=1 Tax=Nitrosopumilus sp. TaxID=2024843 RepID=UPI002931516D|nr:hypothetical protein [Nitrosopumilus sp.]